MSERSTTELRWADVAPYIPDGPVHLLRCQDTGYEFYTPFSLEGPPEFYATLYGAGENEDWAYQTVKWEYAAAARFVAEGHRLLDIGSGGGDFLLYIREKCAPTGLELSPYGLERTRSKGLDAANETIRGTCGFKCRCLSDGHGFSGSGTCCRRQRISDGCRARPGTRRPSDHRGAQQPVVILHGIGTPQRRLEPGEEVFWLSPTQFCAALDHIVDMGEAAPHITFDDGNASDIRIALPELEKRGLRASFFLLSGRLGTPGSLSPQDVATLAQAGHRIGLHGQDHVDWRCLDAAGRQREFVTARETLATLAGTTIETAAAPFGLYDRQTLQDLRRLGFTALYTSDRGLARSDTFIRPRNCLEGTMSDAALRAALRGHVSLLRHPRRVLGIARKRLLPVRTRP